MKQLFLIFVFTMIFAASEVDAANEIIPETIIENQIYTPCKDPNCLVDHQMNQYNYENWKLKEGDRGPFEIEILPMDNTPLEKSSTNNILIVVNSVLYDSISVEIERYRVDLQNENYIPYLALTSGGTPQELRDTIISTYNNLDELLGIVLIGDLPVALYGDYYYFNVYDTIDDTTIVSYLDSALEADPIDQFFQDMDGEWYDNDLNGVYDSANNDVGPEIWSGRLYAHVLDCYGEREIDLMKNYFRKNHLYRTGQLELNHRGLVYLGIGYQSWLDQEGEPRYMRAAYPDVTLVLSEGVSTNSSALLELLDDNYEFVHPHDHGGVLGTDGCSVVDVDPNVHFFDIFGCHSGDFIWQNQPSSWYIFSQSYGLVCIAYAKGGDYSNREVFYEALANNGSFGQAFLIRQQYINNPEFLVLLGDPTLHTNYCDLALGDADSDLLADDCDNCPLISNYDQTDIDNDYMGDACDTCIDSDHDGFGDPGYPANVCEVDNCPYIYNINQADADSDLVGDRCDSCTDTDGDGYGDPYFSSNTCQTDNCPDTYNPNQLDSDEDGNGDLCDICPYDSEDDIDGDGLCADVDNCPYVYNPSQEDGNSNAEGDSCDCYNIVDSVWSRNIDMSAMDALFSIEQISDGSYIIAGKFGDTNTNAIAAQVNSCGQFIWYDTFGDVSVFNSSAYLMRQTSDGGYIVSGISYNNYNYAWKLDSDFNEEWNWFFTTGFVNSIGPSAIEADNGYYLLAGNYTTGALIFKFDSSTSSYTIYSDSGTTFNDIIKASDGNYLAVGNTLNISGKKVAYVVKIDGNMNLIWEKEIPPYSGTEEIAYAVENTRDSGCVVAGVRIYSSGETNCLVSKLSTQGIHKWSIALGGEGDDEVHAIRINNDYGFVVTGFSYNGSTLFDPYIVDIDSNGNTLQQYWIEESGNQKVYDMDITDDGYYILAGESDNDYYLTKIEIPTPTFLCGDVNTDEVINVGDLSYMCAYLLNGGPAPIPLESGDVDCLSGISVGDLTWLVNFVFKGGSAPCDC